MTIVIFLIVLAVLIFIHELGHFLAARACNIKVEVFALGFGPRIISWKRKETEYALNLIPFGGYVKIFGENPDHASMFGPNAGRSFINKNRFQQAIVLAAGIFFNLVFAWILYAIVFSTGVVATTSGFEKYADQSENQRIMVTYVSPGSPAEKVGFKPGDVLYAATSVEEVQNKINNSGGKAILIPYQRGDVMATSTLTPVTGLVEGRYAVGISMDVVGDLKLSPFKAFTESFTYTVGMIGLTAQGLGNFFLDLFQGQADLETVTGPVGIAGIVGDAADLGFAYLLMITALISINLGIINLVPFPALDGGRLLFVLIESIIRRRIPMKFANALNMVGFTLLMVLMVVITYRDVLKLIG